MAKKSKKLSNKSLSKFIDKIDFIDITMSATHLDYVNHNNVLYTVDGAKRGAKSWIKPYKKPQLLHHNKKMDPIGRVMDYSVENKALEDDEPDNYIKLGIRISDKESIAKVMNGLYYTGSVGSSASRIRCSVCDQVLNVDGLCEHERGSMYDGEKVYWIVDEITYKENSFVNNPADSYARILTIDIGDGPVEYDKFLDNKEKILADFFMEDNMNKNGKNVEMDDAKLSTNTRKKLPDSAFCGPGRSFPAHDKAHVTAGLRLLNRSKFSDATKNKIKACLYRKGKRYGIEPQADDLKETTDLW